MDTLKAQFSIHNLSLENKNIFGIHPGTWGKPSQIANAISSIMTRHNLSSYVALDCNIEPEALSKKTYPLLLMIPTMCGLDTLDPLLFPFLKHIFTIKENLGIVSGYCGSAYYVVDIKDSEEVFYFDPHVVQKAVTKSEQFESFFSQPIQKMEMSQLNPSILLCFECPNEERTKNIIKELTEFPKSPLMYSSQIDDEVINHVLDIDDIELQ
ncbi:Clan CA, family C54, ATG4-like cysteine peptidase [Histomonas meleagridis]|uniref:Clan CA, family C54, ATG4-like cysteine peptidase n=1 Tax=Histomonas meleagridis TaxID=135588 RepID=UPI00355A6A39|nr:Clan CA, family C54, ATG4-like cysteine peptidase [Histomonas meleagridis]KAH0798590.1 Clan CA, family C54, ATG4-like cysteine peptidase [Histomonas meleagridis]